MNKQQRKNFESIRDNVHSEPMTQVEVMKLALEALEWFTAAEQGDEPPINQAITALRQAIEQAQKQETKVKA